MKYLRRFVWYLASRLLLICVAPGLMIVATFYYAMNMANIQVVLKDGMAYRAQVVMMDADPSELTRKYFYAQLLGEQDQVLLAVQQGTSPYKDYNVRGHRPPAGNGIGDVVLAVGGDGPGGYYRAHPPHRWPCQGNRRADALVAAGGSAGADPRAWQSAKYRAVLVKEERPNGAYEALRSCRSKQQNHI